MAEEKAQEVEAEVIEYDLTVPNQYDAWLADMRGKVMAHRGDFQPHEIVNADDYRQSKRERAGARRLRKELDDDRKARSKALKDALDRINADTRSVLAPLDEADAGYKRELDAYDKRIVDAHYEALKAEWREQYPDQAEYVSFDTLWHKVAHTAKWDSSSANIERMKAELSVYAQRIAESIGTFSAMDLSDDERAAVVHDYVTTLDHAGAIAAWNGRRLERERMRQREEEHAQWVHEVAQGMQEADGQPEPEAHGAPDTASQRPAEASAGKRDMDAVTVWEVSVPRRQVHAFVTAMKALEGVHGHKIREE